MGKKKGHGQQTGEQAAAVYGGDKVALKFRDALEAGGEAAEEGLVEFRGGFGKAVMDPKAVFAGFDEAGAAEIGQVPGDFWLRW